MTKETHPTLHLTNLRLPEAPGIVTELWVDKGRFSRPLQHSPQVNDPIKTIDLLGGLVLPGLVETHLHLDKACILHRCNPLQGTLPEAIQLTAQAKAGFTEQDVYQRGATVLEKAIVQGTTHIRTHVEIDPVIGLTGFKAIRRLREDYAWAITLEICAFPQEGMFNNPGTEELLHAAMQQGADLLGGCPYTDNLPQAQIRRLFEMARQYNCDLDFHLDFDLDPDKMSLPDVIACTEEFGWEGRVTVGHVTKLSALNADSLKEISAQLASSGVAVTCLPSTDLYLTARNYSFNIPRGLAPLATLHRHGVTCSLSSNNIGNPFTPYGDASLIRQANLFANVAQLGTAEDMYNCLRWVSTRSAKLLRLKDYGLEPGCWADFIVLDATTPAAVIAEIQAPLTGFKRGRQTFVRPAADILY